MFSILLSTSLLCTIVQSQFPSDLYNIYQSNNGNPLDVECFRHYESQSTFNSHSFIHQRFQMMEYCLRPIYEKSLTFDFINTRDKNYTFEELRHLNVTTKHLISWSSTFDLAEKYQYFLDKKDSSSISSELLYFKCKRRWFGSRCQYSFELDTTNRALMVLSQASELKENYGPHEKVIARTCYTNLQCDRGHGSLMCLDWREVCNGRIDCLNGGEDEKECFQLEMNECGVDEYRCHNGLCLSTEVSTSENYLTDCLDRSGTTLLNGYYSSCSRDSFFICEEHSCQPGLRQFACGDGECVEDFGVCKNGRHHLLFESMSVQGNLSDECWLAMICLTKIKDHIDQVSCQKFINLSKIFDSLENCDSLIQFPINPVLFDHIYFLYNTTNMQLMDMKLSFPPNYICYDEKRCDFLQVTYRYENKTCRMAKQMGFKSNVKYTTWKSLIDTIKPYFNGCSIIENNLSEYNSLYCCQNSSKCISKHRILDGITDCYLNDDEEQFQLSCSLNDTHRWKCPDENICYSPLFSKKICNSTVSSRTLSDIPFNQICDRIVHLLPEMINGENYTDETECLSWPCDNIYTRCNLFWNCADGKDEANCSKPLCQFPSHPCVSPFNGTFLCLSVDRMEDGILDCLGGSDELRQCLEMKTVSKDIGHYHCYNENRCLNSDQMCNNRNDCLFGDDETFCKSIHHDCKSFIFYNRSNVELALCQLRSLKYIDYTLQTSPIYPRNPQKMINNRRSERSISAKDMINKVNDLSWSSHCNRGRYAQVWLGENNYTWKCFCPPSYYGDLCEYQTERVSLSLRLTTNNARGIYTIVISLIDNDDKREVNSFSQIYYVPRELICSTSHDIYLLYLNRSKNKTKKYSVHVDAFDKNSLTYIASWYLTIPFLFLPVNRLGVQLIVPTDRVSNSIKCILPCQNGECVKYLNVEKFFCRCIPGWSGVHCQIRSNCADCSSESICIGSVGNRSICICPINKFGSRCILSQSCPPDFCQNNGQCLVTDESATHNTFFCDCRKPFSGERCGFKTPYKLEIAMKDLEISKHIVVCFISVSNNQVSTIHCATERLKMFQNVIILYHTGVFNIITVKINNNYYLAAVQLIDRGDFSTLISSNERCFSINESLNSEIVIMPRIRRVKYYHTICQNYLNLWCFFDEVYMCLCTRERHANCFHRKNNEMKKCRNHFHCLNDGTCTEDDPKCPRLTICICKDCFFGDRCEFYAKGIGLTLDDILRYEIRPNITLRNQPLSIKVSAALTMIMFGLGLINCILSLVVFSNKDCRKVGCGIYLLASSITSFLTLSTLALKYWFLILTQMNITPNRSILRIECVYIESFLKLFLYFDSWLNACVAIERSVTVWQGINFNAKKSKRIAKCIIFFLPLLILGTIIHEFMYRDLFDDEEEERIWCVTRYSYFVQYYNTTILFFHFLGPFLANLFSALFIICQSSRQKATIRTQQSYKQHLYKQLNEHKHLIISPILLVILSIPRLTISLLSSCVKASHNPWLYISGYFISFIPSVLVFIVFVLPSEMYKKQFRESIKHFQRRIHQ
jgi:hypothetical protein